MKKKVFSLMLAIVLVLSTSMVSFAAGKTSKIEKKWLEFYKVLMEQKVKDQLVSKEDANRMIAELEKQISESDEDIIYKRFTHRMGKAPLKDRPSNPQKQLPEHKAPKQNDSACPVPSKDKVEQMQQRQEQFIKIYADLTGKKVDEIKTECEKQDKNIWQLAHAQGELSRFKEAVLTQAKIDIEQKVKKGELTKDEGDEVLRRMIQHITRIDFQ